MQRRAPFLALGLLVTSAATALGSGPGSAAVAQETVAITPPPRLVEQDERWIKPRHSHGFKPTKVTPQTRRVRVEYYDFGCINYKRTEVTRRRHAVVIRIIVTVAVADQPYFIYCAPPVRKTRMVALKGKLGHRSIKDGSTSPPRVRYSAPRRS